MHSEKQVGQAFQDHIRKVGAPIGLKSDNAKSKLHGHMKDILQLCGIDDAQSEPHYQHQNQAERKIHDVKRAMNNAMDHTGCPARTWLLCMTFTLMLFCHLPNAMGRSLSPCKRGRFQTFLSLCISTSGRKCWLNHIKRQDRRTRTVVLPRRGSW